MTIVFSGSPVANVELSDSFNTWRLTTNKLLADAASLTSNNTFAGTLSVAGNVTANSFIGDGGSLTGVATTIATDGGANRSLKIPFTGISSGTLTTANVDSTLLYNPSTGTLTATKVTAVNLNFSSDSKLKDNVQTLVDSSNIVSQLRGVSFNWKDSGETAFGVIAQELQQVVPQLVDTNENGDLTVQYLGLIAFLIESNKQLLDRVDALESK
jgi:hypothetical protein